MMKTKLGLILIACLSAVACQSTRIEILVEEGDMISFSSSTMAASHDTRSGAGSTLVDTDKLLQGQSFGIYGYKSVDDISEFVNVFSSSAAQEVYYTDTELSKTDAKGNAYTVAANTWTYDDRQKWERAKHYRFRAFWPYSADINMASTAKFLAIEYKQVEDYDLMVAYSTRCPREDATTADPTGTRRVPMQFHHALSGVKFCFDFKDGLTNISDVVTGLYVQGLYLSGTMIYGEANTTVDPVDTPETIRWNISSNNFDTTTKIFSWTGTSDESDSNCRKFSVDSDGNHTKAYVFDGDDNVVFTIPQYLNQYDYRQTRVYFTTKSGGTAVQSALIPATDLKPGKIYTYTIIISGSSVKVNVDIEDWTETQSNVDIYF